MMRSPSTPRLQAGLAAFGFCVVLFPLSVVLHELGHFLIGRVFGIPTELHAASVSGLPETAPFGNSPGGVALASLAGPAITMLLVVLGFAFRTRVWGLPLLAVALARFFVNLAYMIQQRFVAAGIAAPSNPNFDEIQAARALDLPPQPLAAVGAVLLLAGLVFLWRFAGPRGFLVLTSGTIAGMVGWLVLLGPRLLP
jgi:hypothetical protein